MAPVSPALMLPGIVSAAGLVAILARRSRGASARLIRPLLAGVLCMNGIGLVLIASAGSPGRAAAAGSRLAAGLPAMAADTAIFGLKLGWLVAFLAFLRRFALPLDKRRYHRLLTAALLPLASLLAFGWAEFLLTSRRVLFDKLQSASDYLVFIAMIGAGLYLRSRSSALVRREAIKAIVALAAFAVFRFLILGLWWSSGGSVGQWTPALAAAFNPLAFLLFNGGLAYWVLRFSPVLTGPEAERFVPTRIPESLTSRFGITRREREIIELVGQGLSNQDIARNLFISLYTVKKHLANVFLKTGVSNRVQLAALFHFEPGPRGEERGPAPHGA